ncbi:MAG TPA: SRPBCC family protein [Polyangiales bacterium]|nr:SRPBCC family protein [Polyangiales bacterium]
MANTDRIEKTVVLRAPRSRVWRALTDVREFASWFHAVLEGELAPGQRVSGHSTYPGHEAARFDIAVERMEPETYFSFRWPHECEPGADSATAPRTLVEFRLEQVPEGTRLTVIESGFDAIPLAQRAEAIRGNAEGWTIQLENIERHVTR